jgi:hypothetical protein
MKIKFFIFIITYKASYRVNRVIKNIPFYFLKKFKYKILISDDCSGDDTLGFIKEIKNKNKKTIDINVNKFNLGYGGNIKKCLNYAYKNNFHFAAMIHGDNQYDSKYIEQMTKLLIKDKCASVTGTRMNSQYSALRGGMPFYKFLGNIFLTNFFNFLYKTSFTDCHTGYWIYDLRKIKKEWIQKFDNNFLFDLDMRLKLTKENLIIKEIPILTRYGSERSSTHIIYALRFLKKIIFRKFF